MILFAAEYARRFGVGTLDAGAKSRLRPIRGAVPQVSSL